MWTTIKSWTDDAWDDYMYWHAKNDKSAIKKINQLIKSIDSTPYEGLGKPEALRFELQGQWSRRISQAERQTVLA
ncbi:Txe/YoeB family addiction module toxin [Lacticaseibacillus jixianensis]|uniref:Endoribonuclease YoeB n=1 Tax=Lacticaseibacillus jixianensis TaxID=2486012 RepID=A0ABW4B844_9LACO